MENICKFYKFGYCKLRDQCEKNHVKEECKDGSHCKAIKICVLRHPKMCKRFVFEGICGFGDMCSYNHKKVLNQHGSDKDELKEDIKNLKVEVEYLKESIKICISSRKESETLEKSLNELKADIKLLTVKNKELTGKINDLENDAEKEGDIIIEKSQNIQSPEVVNAGSNIPAKIKFKCDMCTSSFKKKITLEKHKNIKHSKIYCISNKKIGEGQFGFAFDTRPGKEAEADELRLEWREKMKDYNTPNENEKNVINDTVEKDNNDKSEVTEKSKESELIAVEDYFQLEFVDGEPLFVCNVCDEGLDSETEVKQHIQENHESLLNDDLNSWDDADLYEGFDEEGHRIPQNDEL